MNSKTIDCSTYSLKWVKQKCSRIVNHRDYKAIYQRKGVDLIQSHDKHQAVLRPKLINKNDRKQTNEQRLVHVSNGDIHFIETT